MAKSYLALGAVLILLGLIIALGSYFVIDSTPLTAVGLSACIVGITSAALANSRPKLSPEACQLFLSTGVENITMVLEEWSLKNKGVYIPREMRAGRSQVLIPVYEEGITRFKGQLPGNLIVAYGKNPDEKAIAVTTIGNTCLEMLGDRTGNSAEAIQTDLDYILSRKLDIASEIDVAVSGTKVNIEVNQTDVLDQALLNQDTLYTQCLGSPIASITAAVCCEAFNRPVRISFETARKSRTVIMLEVLPASSDLEIEMTLP